MTLLRRNCDTCVTKKVRCDGVVGQTCTECRKRGLTCAFSMKQKPGPKLRELATDGSPATAAAAGSTLVQSGFAPLLIPTPVPHSRRAGRRGGGGGSSGVGFAVDGNDQGVHGGGGGSVGEPAGGSVATVSEIPTHMADVKDALENVGWSSCPVANTLGGGGKGLEEERAQQWEMSAWFDTEFTVIDFGADVFAGNNVGGSGGISSGGSRVGGNCQQQGPNRDVANHISVHLTADGRGGGGGGGGKGQGEGSARKLATNTTAHSAVRTSGAVGVEPGKGKGPARKAAVTSVGGSSAENWKPSNTQPPLHVAEWACDRQQEGTQMDRQQISPAKPKRKRISAGGGANADETDPRRKRQQKPGQGAVFAKAVAAAAATAAAAAVREKQISAPLAPRARTPPASPLLLQRVRWQRPEQYPLLSRLDSTGTLVCSWRELGGSGVTHVNRDPFSAMRQQKQQQQQQQQQQQGEPCQPLLPRVDSNSSNASWRDLLNTSRAIFSLGGDSSSGGVGGDSGNGTENKGGGWDLVDPRLCAPNKGAGIFEGATCVGKNSCFSGGGGGNGDDYFEVINSDEMEPLDTTILSDSDLSLMAALPPDDTEMPPGGTAVLLGGMLMPPVGAEMPLVGDGGVDGRGGTGLGHGRG